MALLHDVSKGHYNILLDGTAYVGRRTNPMQWFTEDGKLEFTLDDDSTVIEGYFKGFSLDGVILTPTRDIVPSVEVSLSLSTPGPITVPEGTAPGTVLATINVVGGTGTWEFSTVDDGPFDLGVVVGTGGNQAEIRVFTTPNFDNYTGSAVDQIIVSATQGNEFLQKTYSIEVTDVAPSAGGSYAATYLITGIL